MMDDFIR